MRILASRHHWYPRTRIGGLRRIAFIGDSNVFGQGVNAAEAFPARAGVLMNESTGLPVESVNLGVNGYNIWNSWLSFKQLPQVYDGVVFTLCNNDAQLFGRSFEVDYRNADPVLWERGHAYRGLIVDVFDDIAAFGRNVPILIGYCNLWAGKPFEEIAETMRTLCEERALPFVNFYSYIVERQIPQRELIVSDADHHPSPLAQDAIARHLVPVLRKLGWLSPPSEEDLRAAPGAIAAAADAMIAQDDYPVDVAIAWARSALEGKRRLASRLEDQASLAGVVGCIDAVAGRLEDSNRQWHRHARAAAIVDQLMTSERGLSGALNRAEEETLRLEELGQAIDGGGWAHIAADLLRTLPDAAPSDGVSSAWHRSGELRVALERIGSLDAGEDGRAPNAGGRGYAADVREATRLAMATKHCLARFARAVERIQARLDAESDRRSDNRLVLLTLASNSAAMAMERFERLTAALTQLVTPQQMDGHETTIEVLLRTNGIEGRHPCLVEVIANYTAPRRLAMRESRYFLPDGEPKLLAMRLPLFYAGRIVVSLRLPPAMAASIEADITEVRLSNTSGRRVIPRTEFITDNQARLLSPQVWLV